MKHRFTATIAILILCLNAMAKTQPQQIQHSVVDSLAVYHEFTGINSGQIQQEMIYLHLDNTAYYRDDRIYFACYVVTSGKLKPSDLSRTVYVELLNPSGKIIDRCVLKTVDGRCHGSLLVNEQPFYSGYYEIRAYTRYMLSFDPETAFSRIIPVFNTPSVDGNWSDRNMLKYGSPKMTFSRPKPTKAKDVNLKFYPEGGRLVAGLPATVAFEVTDAQRRPLEATGRVIDKSDGSVLATFTSGHMGRGTFSFTPNNRKNRVELTVGHKHYTYDLPETVENGIGLSVDNIQYADSVKITVRRTPKSPIKAVGTTLTCRNELCGRAILDLSDTDSVVFSVARAKMPTGVVQLTLFDTEGSPLADRLFFNNRNDFIRFDYTFDKPQYGPMEPVEMQVRMSNPAPFSISVTDAENQVPYGSNIMADLLLSSEIKGYIHNPAWYFQESDDTTRQRALDCLLMVQGWRRYPWRRLAGMEAFSVDSLPEKGIEVHGQILERNHNKPVKGADVSAMITRLSTDSTIQNTLYFDTYTTDANGRFAFRCYVKGKYLMTISTAKNRRLTSSRIILNKSERPDIRAYDPGEMQIPYGDIENTKYLEAGNVEAEKDDIIPIKGRLLKEIKVTSKLAPWDLIEVVENSTASYDIETINDTFLDKGKKHIRNLKDLLPRIDPNFTYYRDIQYKGKGVIFVLDYDLGKETKYFVPDSIDPDVIPIEKIKNIYITSKDEIIYEYFSNKYRGESMNFILDRCREIGCVVYMEPHPTIRVKTRPGMRHTTLEGYSDIVEFYSPDYSDVAPFDTDFRRTLYWNPEVKPDSTGKATIRFYNNSRAKNFGISTATVSTDGALGGN